MTPNPNYYTVGQIADLLDEPVPRVAYIISKLKLKPVARVGIIRQFSEQQIEVIRQGLYGLRIHTTIRSYKGVNHVE